jgi:Fur family transcriptional regulator, ferric uptake regulator
MTSAFDLKVLRLKVTSSRLQILNLFGEATNTRHYSVDDIQKIFMARNISVGQSTIYRTVDQLERAGILRRSSFGSGKSMYELANGPHHDHLICLECGAVMEFSDDTIECRQRKVASHLGFELQDHMMAIYAHCINVNCTKRLGCRK